MDNASRLMTLPLGPESDGKFRFRYGPSRNEYDVARFEAEEGLRVYSPVDAVSSLIQDLVLVRDGRLFPVPGVKRISLGIIGTDFVVNLDIRLSADGANPIRARNVISGVDSIVVARGELLAWTGGLLLEALLDPNMENTEDQESRFRALFRNDDRLGLSVLDKINFAYVLDLREHWLGGEPHYFQPD